MSAAMKPDCVVIGAGPAGLGAALAAREAGLKDVMLIERDVELAEYSPSVSMTASAPSSSTRSSPGPSTPNDMSTAWRRPISISS